MQPKYFGLFEGKLVRAEIVFCSILIILIKHFNKKSLSDFSISATPMLFFKNQFINVINSVIRLILKLIFCWNEYVRELSTQIFRIRYYMEHVNCYKKERQEQL